MHRVITNNQYNIVDHISRNKLDNRKSNLRKCSASQNGYNKCIRSDNTSGIIGISWNEDKQKWAAYINKERKRIPLGYFTDKESAVRARLRAEAEYHNEFAPQQHMFKQYEFDK